MKHMRWCRVCGVSAIVLSVLVSAGSALADPMIDEADEGLTTATVKRLFAELRRELIPMVRAICDQPSADDGCLHRSFGEVAQLGFGLSVAAHMGYDQSCGRP